MKATLGMSRRALLRNLGAAALVPVLPGLAMAGAASDTRKRFVLIILRGALDGLAAVQPYADPELKALRAALLVPQEQLLLLDSFFGLHPALTQLYGFYEKCELEVFHAIASPYRERSHFDGQNVLETGLSKVDQTSSGWLNRCIARLPGAGQAAMAVGQVLPRVLQGPMPVGAWTPDTLPALSASTLQRLERLYAEDAFLATRLQQALQAEALVAGSEMADGSVRQGSLPHLAEVAARFLGTEQGPVIAVLEAGGWDTHANQGAARGPLAVHLRELDMAVATLARGLADYWQDTQVLLVTEFGRTAAVNGSGGTDHGTASVAFRLGGGITGGLVRADWPGLASGSLHEGRDLRPTRDLRQLYREAAVHLTGSADGFEV